MDRRNMMILIGINRCLKRDTCTHICKKNGEILGGAILFEEGRKLYVGRIFINPQHFGQGYGIQLMRDIECCFPDVYVIQLDTPIWNVRTNRFYRKCGYRQTGKDIESVYYEKCKNEGYSL